MGKHIGTGKSFRFSAEELALLDDLAAEHGGQKAAVIAGLRALAASKQLALADVLAAIKRNWKGK